MVISLGPGLSWIDYDNDGDDDLFIAAGKGYAMGAFENVGNGRFHRINYIPFKDKANADQTTILGWNTGEGFWLIIGNANYETGNINAPSAYNYKIHSADSVSKHSIPGILSTTGPLATADYDQDGDLDLFVGGRFLPGHYPQSATSRLFKNENGSFKLDRRNLPLLHKIGLVTSATFTDFDRDGDADLLVSQEWGSLKLFENNDGRFRDITKKTGLNNCKGWWNGVATGDFNNDGLPDIVATNQGLNSSYQIKNGQPLRMYYGDFNGSHHTDIIEAATNRDGKYMPQKKLYHFKNIPVISGRGMTYKQFGEVTMHDLFGDRLKKVPYKEINTLQNTVFINTGSGFKAHPLPIGAQFSTAFDVDVADFNNDGNEDLFLTQNFFDVHRQVPRQDAGRGLWLQGDGTGSFTVVQGSTSGIKIYGKQRAAALSDVNNDGKVDLAVSQNEAKIKLYLNKTPKPGVRITLKGPSKNRDAIGSAIRLIYRDGTKGPLREIKAGSGYWSQNSTTQILGAKKGLKNIDVKWFDGTKQTVNAIKNKISYIISGSSQ